MRIKTGKGTISLATLIAIWSISAVISLPGLAVSPILGRLHRIFPDVSDLGIQMLTSLPSLLIIPFVLLAGKLSVSKDNIKLLLLGLILFFASALLYFFATSMTELIIISCLLGIGAGIVIPFSTGLIVDYFSGRYRTQQLGLSSAINNLTLVIATFFTGFLAQINWHLPFVVYLLPGIPILLSVFLRRDRNNLDLGKAAQEDKQHGPKIDRPKLVGLMILYFAITYCALAVAFYLPFLVQDYHMTSRVSGMLIALFFLSITVPGFYFNRIIGWLKNSINIVSLGSIFAGLLILGVSRHGGLMAVGCLFTGLGYGIMQPLIYEKTASIATFKLSTLALAFVMSVNYLAIVVCPFIVDFIRHIFHTQSDRFPFFFNAAIALGLCVYAFFRTDSFALGLSPAYYAHRESTLQKTAVSQAPDAKEHKSESGKS